MYVSKCFKSNNLFNSNYLSIKLFLLYKLLKITVTVFTFLALLGARLGAGVVNILIPNTVKAQPSQIKSLSFYLLTFKILTGNTSIGVRGAGLTLRPLALCIPGAGGPCAGFWGATCCWGATAGGWPAAATFCAATCGGGKTAA